MTQHTGPHSKLILSPRLVVAAITVFGALLRAYHLGFKSLWLDEAILYWISKGTLADVLAQNASQGAAPPFYALALNLIMSVTETEVGLRLIAWIGGVSAIPAVYFLARHFLPGLPAYFTTLLVAIAPMQVQYSQQVREYSWTFVAAALAIAFFLRHMRSPGWKNWAMMTLTFGACICVQYGLALLVLALNLVFVVEFARARERRGGLLLSWGASQVCVIGVVWWVYHLALKEQMIVGYGNTPMTNYLAGAYWNGALANLVHLATNNTLGILSFTFTAPMLFVPTVFLGILVAARNPNGRQALGLLAAPFLIAFIAGVAKLYPYHGARHAILLTPMIYVMAGFGFQLFFDWLRKPALAWILLLLLAAAGMNASLHYLNDRGPENLRPVVEKLAASYAPGDCIYVYYSARPAFTYYYQGHPGTWVSSAFGRLDPSLYYKQLDELLHSEGRIWMIFSHCYAEECSQITEYVAARRKMDTVLIDAGASLYLAHP